MDNVDGYSFADAEFSWGPQPAPDTTVAPAGADPEAVFNAFSTA